MRRRFVTLDVFTSQRFAGNPLAVVLESEGLDKRAMQAVAREFNLSETVFVLPAEDARHRASIRIFTPGRELPFAGHPTVGAAVLLRQLDGGSDERDIVLEEGVGPVRCVAQLHSTYGSARFDVPKLPSHLGEIGDAAAVAAAVGLALDDLGCRDFAPGVWSAGNPFTFLPVRGIDAISRARPDAAAWDAAFGPDDPFGVFLFCDETTDAMNAFHARMFAPGVGVPEDPATGSAVAAFAGLVARFGSLTDGEHSLAVEQGYEMGRPSLMRLQLSLRGGELTAAAIGGDAVVVSEGTIEA